MTDKEMNDLAKEFADSQWKDADLARPYIRQLHQDALDTCQSFLRLIADRYTLTPKTPKK